MRRRTFLTALPVLLGASRWPAPPRRLGLALSREALGSPAEQGIRFARREAGRSTPGGEVRWEERSGADAAAALAAAGAELVIALGDVGLLAQPRLPVLRVPLSPSDGNSCGSGEWQVGPTLEQRNEVLLAYRSTHPGAPADLRVQAWSPSLEKHGARQLNERFLSFAGAPMQESAWLGWIATRIALAASLRGEPETQLAAPAFELDGHKGIALHFEPVTRRLRQPLYVLAHAAAAPPLAGMMPEAMPAICTIEGGILR